jgi:hypothetical protein
MPHHNSIFHHLLKVIPHHRFERLVDVHKGDYRVRHLRCLYHCYMPIDWV